MCNAHRCYRNPSTRRIPTTTIPPAWRASIPTPPATIIRRSPLQHPHLAGCRRTVATTMTPTALTVGRAHRWTGTMPVITAIIAIALTAGLPTARQPMVATDSSSNRRPIITVSSTTTYRPQRGGVAMTVAEYRRDAGPPATR